MLCSSGGLRGLQKENIDRATGETLLPPVAGHTSCTGSALWQCISRDVSQLPRNSTVTVVASLVADCHSGVGTSRTNISLLRLIFFKEENEKKKKNKKACSLQEWTRNKLHHKLLC